VYYEYWKDWRPTSHLYWHDYWIVVEGSGSGLIRYQCHLRRHSRISSLLSRSCVGEYRPFYRVLSSLVRGCLMIFVWSFLAKHPCLLDTAWAATLDNSLGLSFFDPKIRNFMFGSLLRRPEETGRNRGSCSAAIRRKREKRNTRTIVSTGILEISSEIDPPQDSNTLTT
jgi:hypothetical protein